MTRTRLHGLAVLGWLTVVWVLLWGTVSVANIAGGVVVAVLVRTLLPLPTVPTEGRIRPLALLRLVGRVVVDLVVSSAEVAWLSVRPGAPPRSSITSVQLSTPSDLVLSLVVNVLNLQPGTLVVDMDRSSRVLYVHVLQMIHRDTDADAGAARLRSDTLRLERLLTATFAAPHELEDTR